MAVWDTVGTLGVPELDISGLKLFASDPREYSFVNTEVALNVEYAYQALALDENRKAFSPTVWESPKPGAPSMLKLLKQCWFPGVHASVGGGFRDTSVADVTLAWMVSQLRHHLAFDPGYVLAQQKLNESFYIDNSLAVRSWAMGSIPKSGGGLINQITGQQPRTPGNYHATNPVTGQPLSRKLTNTCEFVHPSVRYRIQQKGPGLSKSDMDAGEGFYSPTALPGWEYSAPGQPLPDNGGISAQDAERWQGYGKWIVWNDDGSVTFIVEEDIESDSEEMKLLRAWPGVAEKVLE